ncbi:MAG: FxsA family protein [Actinomycetota bacterium]|nr:FxsA family protein [Actinomycetota bacterium]MDQ3679370.1 FxsA family protein [Actinomycetota bacterium]
MFALLALLFLVVPFVELFIIIQVGQAIGAPWTIGILILISAVGAWLVKREGVGVLRRARARMRSGEVPGAELTDGVFIIFAGALLLTPGFVTDVVGVLLLLPPVRSGLRRAATRSYRRRHRAHPPQRW